VLTKNDEGQIVIRKDWGPSMISIGYSRPGPSNCRIVSWDMERLQSSLLRKFKPNFRDRILTVLRIQRMYF
jgi:hypothetical protein